MSSYREYSYPSFKFNIDLYIQVLNFYLNKIDWHGFNFNKPLPTSAPGFGKKVMA